MTIKLGTDLTGFCSIEQQSHLVQPLGLSELLVRCPSDCLLSCLQQQRMIQLVHLIVVNL